MKLSITTSCVFSCVLSAALLSQDQHHIVAMTTKSKQEAERAVTMWWVLFNKPSNCITNPDGPVQCGVPDIMENAQGGTNDPKIAIINASGGISDSTGFLRLAAALYKTSSCALELEADNGQYVWGGPPPLYEGRGSSFGYCPVNGEVTEVHIVMRDHGPVTADKIKQLTTFTDPSCSQAGAGGSNLCVDIGAVGFPPMSEDGLMTKDIGHFPKFPPGCADAEDSPCDKNVEMIQLMAGMGNEVTLVQTGDALQVVAEITVPKVDMVGCMVKKEKLGYKKCDNLNKNKCAAETLCVMNEETKKCAHVCDDKNKSDCKLPTFKGKKICQFQK